MPQSEQDSLFPALAAAPAAGLFAHVVFNRPLEQLFTYFVPPELEHAVAVGKRVLAPFGRGDRPAVGYCVEVTDRSPDRAVKALRRVLDDEPLLTPALLRLTRWMADYYLCGWGQVLDAVLPAGAKERAGTRMRRFVALRPESDWPQPPPRLSAKQQQVIDVLRGEARPIEARMLARQAACGFAVVQGLVKKGIASLEELRVDDFEVPIDEHPRDVPLTLNPDQLRAQSAIEQALNGQRFQAFLLHGVTGSGKTEIYLQAIAQAVRQGREAIVLVPEISLTPQTIERFRGRFPNVAVLHSQLSDAERGWHWRQIAAGKVQVVVGARSAVYAPTQRLGLIVVDEEHENTFKQETTPRYHGRDVAVMRARLESIPVVLGSATPSLESWHNAQRGQYTLLSLPVRVLDRPLPHVGLIDLRHEPPRRGRYRAISATLERAIHEALGQCGQVILLLNRRGFSTYISCPACGQVVRCRFCDVALTYHQKRETALCHYCGYEEPPPGECPNPECRLRQLSYLGQGTEKLEAEIEQRFPGIAAQRMDSDSMKRRGSHKQALEGFRRGDTRILFGTQMIAKGLDFPNVTLVGVINADTVLHMPDFRSAERTFQLLAQVAGRTGRGPRGGKVLVQSFDPQTPCIALASRHDYLGFAELELRQRQEHHYPPFSRLARVLVRGKQQEQVEQFAKLLAEAFRKPLASSRPTGAPGQGLRLLGPAEAPLFKLQNHYRYHFQIQSGSSAALHELLKQALPAYRPPKGVEVTVDVDPLNML